MTQPKGDGLRFERVLTREGVSPYDAMAWETRTASITDEKGNTIFEQKNVEAPKAWSALATNIAASKYFYGDTGKGEREHSVRQLVHRVAHTIAAWGEAAGYFASAQDAEVFHAELAAVCLQQAGAFNSPVWFNVGLHQAYGISAPGKHNFNWSETRQQIEETADVYHTPQVSACFIQAVNDTIEGIMGLAAAEATLFKYGSGSGTDLSPIRSCRERLSGGGTPSGPLSFMRVFDQVAGVIKSGGKTRRAAKMQSLRVDHPDIMEFITCKRDEEKKALALVAQGYDGSFCGEAYGSVMFQNANLSVRVSDAFMKAVLNDEEWNTRAVTTGQTLGTHRARAVMQTIADSAHACGDPGLQYDSTINRWHTCSDTSRINASNPCSEYMFVDDSACNLASINLMKFVDREGRFDVERFRHVVRILIVAQEILVDSANYPTAQIARNSHDYRPLGLGYANLGALLMRLGHPYDSDGGRAYAAAVTALLTGYAYTASIELAREKGPFAAYGPNRASMLRVMGKHNAALGDVPREHCPPELLRAAREAWSAVESDGARYGFRNAQTTVLAPTGTIGFLMDCDTTGIEPDMALIKYKQMAGGGVLKIVNQSVRNALERLGYTEAQGVAIVDYMQEHDTIEGAPGLQADHLPVFDCAFRPVNGTRCISWLAHLRMMGAVQPFLSGAISKTINMPRESTADDILQAYIEGWKLGLKAVAVYRDGSKSQQPVQTRKETEGAGETAQPGKPYRRRMPETRMSITHKFVVGGHEGYLTVGLYPDSAPGELFITMAKEGSTVGGLMDAFGTAISMCLQYGVPVSVLARKFSHMRFEPSGWTPNPDVPMAKSLVDYIFRWMEITFPNGHAHGTQATPPGVLRPEVEGDAAPTARPGERVDDAFRHFSEDAPVCDQCGAITVRNGACYRCHNCGNSMGCS